MVRELVGQEKLTGRYEEDLKGILETFETYENMCDLTAIQKRKSIPKMINGNELSLFKKAENSSVTLEETVELLRTWYN